MSESVYPVPKQWARAQRVLPSTALTSRRSAPRPEQRGRAAQAIGRSRGGWTTKIHTLTDVIGRPYALMLTPGNVSDMKAAPAPPSDRERILSPQGFPAYPHPLRQTRCQLPLRRSARHRRRLLALIEFQR